MTDDVETPTVVEPPSDASPPPGDGSGNGSGNGAGGAGDDGGEQTGAAGGRGRAQARGQAQHGADVRRVGDPDRRRGRHRDRDQDVPVPGLLHPLGLDGTDAADRRPGARQQAELRPPRPPPRRHRRVRGRAQRGVAPRRHRRPGEAGDRAPGETLTQCETNRVCINGRLLDESYLPKGTVTDIPTTLPYITNAAGKQVLVCDADSPKGGCKVPAGKVFVMGDNRTNSSDARANGPIKESSIVGRSSSASGRRDASASCSRSPLAVSDGAIDGAVRCGIPRPSPPCGRRGRSTPRRCPSPAARGGGGPPGRPIRTPAPRSGGTVRPARRSSRSGAC